MKTAGKKRSTAVKKSAKKAAVKRTVKRALPRTGARTAVSPVSAAKKTVLSSIASKQTIEVVEMGADSFIVVINGARNFFTRDEMRALVRICHQAMTESHAAAKLYAWMSGKRKDVLIDTRVYDQHDMSLKTMYRHLVKTYSIAG